MYDEPREFRQLLLARTLQHAAEKVAFYRSLPGLRERGPSLSLEDFPILEKEQMATNLQQFLVLDRFPDYIVTSGGTSGGIPNITFRNDEEYQAAHHYLTGVSPDRFPELRTIKDFTLDIFFNSNGYYWRKAPGWPLLSMTLEQPAHAEVIKVLIKDGLVVGNQVIPVTRVQCQNGPLRTLTGYFWATEFSPRHFSVRSLHVYGAHISRVWRERLRQFWGVEASILYGLSEFGIGNALQCGHCGSYHYWTAWPEFLALDRSGPVERGDAMLVLTSLVPFTHVQPRIRYLTGDLVSVTGYCEMADQLGFRFRGRSASSVLAFDGNGSEVLLSEVEVIEVLDQLPGVSCRAHSSEYQLWFDPDIPRPPFPMGAPRFKISPPPLVDGPRTLEILIETSFDPSAEAESASRFRDQFLTTLFSEFPHLPQRLSTFQITLRVELLAPGALKIRVKSSN